MHIDKDVVLENHIIYNKLADFLAQIKDNYWSIYDLPTNEALFFNSMK